MEVKIKRKQCQLQQLQDSILTSEDVKRERTYREELEELLNREELMWAQKARTKWFLHGDRNTRYFQTVVRQRRSRNRILQIKDEHGHYIDVHEEIEQIFIDSFQRNFSCNSILTVESIIQEIRGLSIPSLTDQQVLLLNRGISIFEIEEAVFQIGPHKAPGPDGIPGFFFQNFWSIIKTDVCNAIQAFFHSGSLFKAFNHTFITPIPKLPNPEEVSHFRPISLCNVFYKIISKILVNRLKPIMDSIITPFQNAFIKGRNITDNILLAHEIIDVVRKKRGKRDSYGVLKIDVSKAYDRVNWNFLKAILTVMRFDPK